MRGRQLWCVLLAFAAGPAAAQDRPADWLKAPRAEDIAAVWPSAALKEGIGGKAIISCVVTVTGTLRACRAIQEEPAGSGFGAAGVALSSQFLMKPALKGGVPVESVVSIPVQFPRPDPQTGSHLRRAPDATFQGDRVYTRLAWRTAPTHAEVLAAYPAKARAKKEGGTTTLDCRIDKDGGLSGCRTLSETPDGLEIASAARKLVPLFRAPLQDGKGKSTAGARTHLRVSFAAASLEAGVPQIGKPDWSAFPTMDDFTAVVPPAAKAAKTYKARVVMTCRVAAEGALDDCVVQSEDPAGIGYGAAAQTLSRAFRLTVWTEEGLPTVGGRIRMPLRFDLESAMAEPAAPPSPKP